MSTPFPSRPSLPQVPHLDKVFVAGRWSDSTGGTSVAVPCPADEEIIANVTMPSVADADRAVLAARKAFDEGPWPRLPVAERIRYCERFADALESRLERLNIAWMLESGAPLSYCEMLNSGAGRMVWRNAIELARKVEFEERRSGPMGDVLIVHEPIGTVLAILTYNGPVILLGLKVFPALLAGCPVIVKQAPESPLTARIVAEAAAEAEFPPGVISVLPAGTEVTQHLVGHAGVDMIALTGGTAIAKDVVQRSAGRLARTALELGGKSAAVLTDDVKLDKMLGTLVDGAMGFMGQVCITLSRVLVSERRYDEVAEALAAAYRKLKIGVPWDAQNDRGPLTVERALTRTETAVGAALKEGATLVTGGRRPPRLKRGWYYEPTLLRGVNNSMDVAQEEIFGPVTVLIPYKDVDDAVRIANDSKYGLAGAVFSENEDLALSIARRIRSGGLAINLAGVSLTEPIGGFKQSGWGRECGVEGLLGFTDIKQILLRGSFMAAGV